jgi:hypothetical protein
MFFVLSSIGLIPVFYRPISLSTFWIDIILFKFLEFIEILVLAEGEKGSAREF